MIEKIKNAFIKIATLNSIGNLCLGGMLSMLLAIPFLYLFQLFYSFTPGLSHFSWIVLISICLFSIYLSLKEHASSIVLHKFVGAMIAFYHVPLTLKIVFSGIILFYVCDYLVSLFIFKTCNQTDISKFKQIIHLLGSSILSGIIVNIFFHFVLWITH